MSNQDLSEAETLYLIGIGSMESGDTAYAEECFLSALENDPFYAEAYANLGLLLDRRGAAESAEAAIVFL